MKWRLPYSICTLCFTCIMASAGDPYSFRLYRSPVSVTDDRIMDLYETSEGSLWVAIWGKGVCRINGTDSRTFTAADGLPSDWVRCLTPDSENGIWVGSADGIAHIVEDDVRAYTTTTTPALPYNSVRCGVVLRSGMLCFGLASGGVLTRGGNPFAKSSPAESAEDWTYIGYPEIPSPEGVDNILHASDGSIWIALHNGEVLQFAGDRWLRHDATRGLTVHVSHLLEDSAGTIWGAGGVSLAAFAGNQWKVMEGDADTPRVLAESSSGELFVGTDEGIRMRDADGWRTLDLGSDTGSPSISALLFGKTGAPWVGTREGLLRGSTPVWATILTAPDDAPVRSVPLYADLHTPPLSADAEGNFIQFLDGQWRPVAHINDGRFHPHWISPPKEGVLWALCSNDALRVEVDAGRVLEVVPLPPKSQKIRLKWGPDDSPWSLGNNGVHVLEDGRWRQLERHPDTRASWAYDMDVAVDGTVYVCYESGIDIWKDGSVRPLRVFQDLPRGGHFTSVRCMRDGTVWFGTYGNGIVVYDGHSTKRITRSDGLESDHVSQIFEASDGTVWVAYRRKGVSSFKNGHWIYFGHRHGLPNAAVATFGEHPAGTIWLASDAKGLFFYAPDALGPETTITAATNTIAAGGTGVFSFTGIDAWHRTRPSEVTYSWRIVPKGEPETAWGPVQHSSAAVVSGLPAGQYVFEVRAHDEDRNFDATPSAFAVTIEAPFYSRTGFVIPVGILATLVAISLVILYMKHVRLQDSERSLRQSEAGLAEAQRIAQVGNWEWNVTRNTMTCSPQVSRVLGWPTVERRPKVEAIRASIHPEDVELVDEKMNRTIESGLPLDFDHRVVRPNGEIRVIHQRGEVLTDRLSGDRLMRGTLQDITERNQAQVDRELLIGELQNALAHIKTLRGLIPICASCKRIRDDSGYWNQLETFIKERSEAEFSHAICPDCAKRIYGVDDLMDN